MANWTGSQFVFLDESGITTKVGQPTYGYGQKGQPIAYPVKTYRAENLSVLLAFTIDSYMACNMYEGGVNKEMFYDFIEYEILPKCGRYPEAKSVIIMDNAKIHWNEVLILPKCPIANIITGA